MITKEKIDTVMQSSIGSTILFKREPFKGFVYTEGVMVVQKELGMYWFVDMVISYIPTVIKDYKQSKESLYNVILKVEDNHHAYFEISREVEMKKGENIFYQDLIIAKQNIDYTDLPECEMKFFLGLENISPVTFCLLCPSEY